VLYIPGNEIKKIFVKRGIILYGISANASVARNASTSARNTPSTLRVLN
jgi:hypothetical protein